MLDPFVIFWEAVFGDNIILFQFLGLVLVILTTDNLKKAFHLLVPLVVTAFFTSIVGLLGYRLIIVQYELYYLESLLMVLTVFGSGLLGYTLWSKTIHYLPAELDKLIAGGMINSVSLGLLLNNISAGYEPLQWLMATLGTLVGFGLVLLIVAGIRERMEKTEIPVFFKGLPITFICMGLLAMIFTGFRFLQ